MRRSVLIGSVLALVSGLVAAAPTAAQAATPAVKHPITKIAFADANLFSVNPDGTGLHQVTTTGDVANPSFSPDGSTIVFSHGEQLWLVKPGHAPTQLTHLAAGLQAAQPKWSPDGKWIVYTHRVDGYRDLFKIRPTGGASTRMTWASSSQCYASDPAWSPDGSMIAFVRSQNGLPTCTAGVFVQRLGSKPVLTIPDLTARGASFTADNQHLVYAAQCDDPDVCGDNLVGFESTLAYAKVHRVSEPGDDCHGDLCFESILASPAGGWVGLASYAESDDPTSFHESCWQGGRDAATGPAPAPPTFCLGVFGYDFAVH